MSKRSEQDQSLEITAPESKSLVSTTLPAVPASKLIFQPLESKGSRVLP